MKPTTTALSVATTRREALKIGGLTVSLGALVAACGEGVGGSQDPGRVGNAPVVTPLPDYLVDDAVLLRTAASLEYTAVAVYERALALDGAVPESLRPTVDRLIADHTETALEMVRLTAANGGAPWTCPNPWFIERLVDPIFAAIQQPGVAAPSDPEDDPVEVERSAEEIQADVLSFAIALEEFAAASHQELASAVGGSESKVAHAEAAALESRHAAVLAIDSGQDAKNYISPDLLGEDVPPDALGGFPQYGLGSTFGLTSQIEIKAGPADLNGVRTSYILQTPSDNSLVYNELSCDA